MDTLPEIEILEGLSEAEAAEAAVVGALWSAVCFSLWHEAQCLPDEQTSLAGELEAAAVAPLDFTPVELPGMPGGQAPQIEIYTISSPDSRLQTRIPRGQVWVCGLGAGARVVPAALRLMRYAVGQAIEEWQETEDHKEYPCRGCGTEDATEWVEVDLCGACFDADGKGEPESSGAPRRQPDPAEVAAEGEARRLTGQPNAEDEI